MIGSGTRVGAYRSREYLKDMGTPERLAKVETDLATGIVAGRRADRPMPAILLDRDGTINVERGRITHPDDIELIAGVAAAIKRAHAAGYLVAVVTNQPVIARGDCTFEELDAIHARMELLLAESRAYVDAIYVCPHHPDRGFEGEIPHLKGPCRCRKPATGLVEDAVRELNLDTSATWLIGDSSSDVACALAAGLIPAVVSTGHAGNDGRHPTHLALRFATTADAVDFAIDVFPAAWRRCLDAVGKARNMATLRAIGYSAEEADNLARLLALAAVRLGRRASMRLMKTPGDADPAPEVDMESGIVIAAEVSAEGARDHIIAVA
jgi:histidinol-phosphate phosphatase family protein